MKRLLDGIEDGRMKWECGETVRKLMRETHGLSPQVANILQEQECVLAVCKSAQVVKPFRHTPKILLDA